MNTKLRDDMNFLHGQIAAMGFMIEQPIFDLWESIQEQYEKIMTQMLAPDIRFQSLHPCEHQWESYKSEKGTIIPRCEKCGEMLI